MSNKASVMLADVAFNDVLGKYVTQYLALSAGDYVSKTALVCAVERFVYDTGVVASEKDSMMATFITRVKSGGGT
jgi:hypothetical protein